MARNTRRKSDKKSGKKSDKKPGKKSDKKPGKKPGKEPSRERIPGGHVADGATSVAEAGYPSSGPHESVPDSEYRMHIHQRMVALRNALEGGTLTLPRDERIKRSLLRIRLAPDGLIDLDSVDATARAIGLAVLASDTRQAHLETPLRDSQSNYFDMLDGLFGHFHREMRKHGLTPQQMGRWAAGDTSSVASWVNSRAGLAEAVKAFWYEHGPVVHTHLAELSGLKSVFGGDLFPSHSENVAQSTGLYMDTIILPDPLLRCLCTLGMYTPEIQLEVAVEKVLAAMQYRDLALAETNLPIVVFAPERDVLDTSTRGFLDRQSRRDALSHLSAVFGRDFGSLEAAGDFLKSLSGFDAVVAAVTNPERLLLDQDRELPLSEQLRQWATELRDEMPGVPWKTDGGEHILGLTVGRMTQANSLMVKARAFDATPLVQAEVSWRYLLWKFEYEHQRSGTPPEGLRDVMIGRSLLSYSGQPNSLIAGIPDRALIELRKAGALQELRALIAEGVDQLRFVDQDDGVALQTVIENIESAFAKHQAEVAALSSRKRKFYGVDVSGWIVTCGLGVAATLTGSTDLGLLALLTGLMAPPPAAELRSREKELRNDGKRINRAPIAILLQAKR